jgi:hypothetical protein
MRTILSNHRTLCLTTCIVRHAEGYTNRRSLFNIKSSLRRGTFQDYLHYYKMKES